MQVKRVFNIEEIENPSSKKIGTASVEFDNGVIIHRFSIVDMGDRMFCASPSMKGTKADGTPGYSDMVEMPKDMKAAITKAILDAAGLSNPNG